MVLVLTRQGKSGVLRRTTYAVSVRAASRCSRLWILSGDMVHGSCDHLNAS